jgi:hypothetical protein
MKYRTAIPTILVPLAALIAAPQAAAADPGQYVRTESGKVRCLVTADDQGHGGGPMVVCEASAPGSIGFPQAPNTTTAGLHWILAAVTGAGAFQWADGNIGGGGTPQNDVVLNYGQSYQMHGWTILPSSDGTTFTNNVTGHGMFVSIDNVNSF